MNKRMAAFDSMWGDWSRRFPGLLDDHDFFMRASNPMDTPQSLLNSFSDLFNRDFGREQVQKITTEEQEKMGITEGQVTRDYTFRDGSGTSSFSFRSVVNNQEATAEGIADSVGFLAQKAQDISRPRVFNILDVAEQRLLMPW